MVLAHNAKQSRKCAETEIAGEERKVEKFRISVRSLVEFLLHSGDIDGGKGGMADKEAMQLGSRIHRKIQGQHGRPGYRPEVS